MDPSILPTDPSTATNYAIWRQEAVIWKKLTALPREKHGLALQYVCRSDVRIQEAVVNIDTTEVECDKGFEIVINTLDQLFNYNEKEQEVKFYDRFQELKRKGGQTVLDLINEFDFLLQEIQKFGNKINESQLALKLINAANLTETQCEIIKATSGLLDYGLVKATMKRTYGSLTDVPEVNGIVSSNLVPNSYVNQNFYGHQPVKEENFFKKMQSKEIDNLSSKCNMNTGNSECIGNNRISGFCEPKKNRKDSCEVNFSKLKYSAKVEETSKYKFVSHNHYSLFESEPLPYIEMPVSTEFNSLLIMDIKIYNGEFLLHLIDLCTYYTVTVVLKSTECKQIQQTISKYWIDIFGPPFEILTCITNEEMDFVALKTYMKSVGTTFSPVAESNWFNGICVENHHVIVKSLDNIFNQSKCSLNVAVTWAVNSKNCTENTLGFSPAQLIYGFNLVLPTVHMSKPPSLSDNSFDKAMVEHLELKKSARLNYVKAESSKIYRRSLNKIYSNGNVESYFCGDMVLYKTSDSSWQGPAVVIGHDEKFVLLNHNKSWIRAHLTRLKFVEDGKFKVANFYIPHKGKYDAKDQSTNKLINESYLKEILSEDKLFKVGQGVTESEVSEGKRNEEEKDVEKYENVENQCQISSSTEIILLVFVTSFFLTFFGLYVFFSKFQRKKHNIFSSNSLFYRKFKDANLNKVIGLLKIGKCKLKSLAVRPLMKLVGNYMHNIKFIDFHEKEILCFFKDRPRTLRKRKIVCNFTRTKTKQRKQKVGFKKKRKVELCDNNLGLKKKKKGGVVGVLINIYCRLVSCVYNYGADGRCTL